MKWLKGIGIFFAVLILIYLTLAIIGPSKFDVERSATIATTQERVQTYLADFHNFPEWSPWEEMDSTIQATYSGAPSGVGAEYAWSGENSGKGRMVILENTPSMIRIGLFFDEQPDTNIAYFRIEPVGDSVKVTWGMDGDIDFIWRPMALMFMQKMIGDAYQDGMNNLKRVIESMPAPTAAYSVVETPAVKIVTIRRKCPVAQISNVLGDIYTKVGTHLATQNVTMDPNQRPFAIYHSFSQTEVELEAGFIVTAAVTPSGDIKYREVPAGRSLRGVHIGHYDNSETTHNAIQAHAQSNGLTITGAPWEFYITDPGSEPDSTKWQTDIYYPVQ